MNMEPCAIVAADLCTGCGLCVGLSPGNVARMEIDTKGYLRPVRARPVGPGADLSRTCPGVRIAAGPNAESTQEVDHDPVWGSVVDTRLGWATDQALRRNASSGGALSAVLTHLLETGEVDHVVQTAVSPASPLRNELTESTHAAAIFAAAGSRYAPSAPLADIARRLDQPGHFAFVGKPCDIAALRALSRVDARVNAKVPYMFAFMCAGVPSYAGTSAVLAAMGVSDHAAVVSFRYRGNGWPGYATAETADGNVYEMDYNTSWGTILNRHLQFRCKICPDGVGEFADITFADGWHCDAHGYPQFEETDGRSLVLTRTRRGEALVRAAVAGGRLEAEPLERSAIAHMQPFQARRKGLVPARLAAMRLMGRPVPRFSGLQLANNARRAGLIANLRSFLGTLRRLAARAGA